MGGEYSRVERRGEERVMMSTCEHHSGDSDYSNSDGNDDGMGDNDEGRS